eukprot:CAMPEP_0117451660 /NCGR_PEP_ID=MMETSP0759-20121206/9133_1 /TAXON_ID=63605 /ORGANISM="Percolomonas cosmopolitus, Strain WS" /LENGTH=1062 /DNA_ID=CAMNT_0005244289 /DNA_START=36 /DNA_END=3221 /DNA_ORIENTATION=-
MTQHQPSKLWQHPYVNVLQLLKQHQSTYGAPAIQGSVTQQISPILGKTVYTLKGNTPSRNTLTFPGKSNVSLSLTGVYVYIYLKLSKKKPFSFYLHIDCKDDSRFKIGFSDLFREQKVKINSIMIPANFLPRQSGKWMLFAVDLEQLIKKSTNGKKIFRSLRSLQFCSSMEVWNVFTSDIIYDVDCFPRDMYLPISKDKNSWHDRYILEWYPMRPFQHLINRDLPVLNQNDGLARSSLGSSLSGTDTITSTTIPPNIAGPLRNPFKTKSLQRFKKAQRILQQRNNASKRFPSTTLHPDPILKCKQIMGFSGAHTSQVLFSTNSDKLFYICHSTIVCLSKKSKKQKLLLGHSDEICAMATNRAGTLLVSAQGGKTPLIRVWNLNTHKCVAILIGHHQDISCLDMNDNGTMIVVVGRDQHQKQLIIMWDVSEVVQNGKPPLIVKHPVLQHIRKVKFVPGTDSKIVTCGDQNIRFWRMKNGVLRGCTISSENLSLTQKQEFLDLAFERAQLDNKLQSDSHKLFISTETGSVYQINYKKRLVECIYQLHEGPIRTIFVNEGICVTGSDDQFIRVWPLDFSDFFLEAQHDSPVTSVVISKDALTLAVGTEKGSIGCLDFTTQKYSTIMRSHTDSILSVDLDPHHAEFATVSKDNTIRVWDVVSFDQLYQFDTVGECPVSIMYHPVQYQIAVGFTSGIVRIFDIATTSVIEEYKAHKTGVLDMLYSADGRWLITVSVESLVISDCLHMYQPIKVMHFLRDSESVSLAMSPNGEYLASCGPAGNIVHLYACAKDFEEVHAFETESSDIFLAVRFTADSKHLLALTSNSRLVRFSIKEDTPPVEHLQAHRKMATCITTSDNGDYIVTGGSDGIVKIWDSEFVRATKTIRTYQSFSAHSGAVNKVLFSKDGDFVISAGTDCVAIWSFNGTYDQRVDLLVKTLVHREENAKEQDDIDLIDDFESQEPKTPDFHHLMGMMHSGAGFAALHADDHLTDSSSGSENGDWQGEMDEHDSNDDQEETHSPVHRLKSSRDSLSPGRHAMRGGDRSMSRPSPKPLEPQSQSSPRNMMKQ